MPDQLPGYILFVDEAGDPGIKNVSTGDARYDWFTLGAVVVRPDVEPSIVDWIREATAGMKGRQSPGLHYRNLTAGGKLAVCDCLGGKPMRAFALASHKTNMRRHLNPRLSTDERSSRFYNWCIRFLFERVTEWCERQSIEDFGEKRPIHVVFSQRGGHNYKKLYWYLFTKLRWQEEAGMLYLERPVIRGMMDASRCEIVPHESRAGLQLADVVASSFYQAANSGITTHDPEPAKKLRRVIARPLAGRSKANFGLTLLPMPEQATIPEADRGIFRFYGYDI